MLAMNAQLIRRSYPNKTFDALLSPAQGTQLVVNNIEAYNGNGASMDIGIYNTIAAPKWKFFNVSGGVSTDMTKIAQSGSPFAIFALNGDAILVQSAYAFGLIAFNVQSAGGGTPALTYQYWNGSTWVALTTNGVADFTSATKQAVVFNEPIDWMPGSNLGDTVDPLYSILITASTAPTGSVDVSGGFPARTIEFNSGIQSNNRLGVQFSGQALRLQASESIIGYFSIADVHNTMEASYQINP